MPPDESQVGSGDLGQTFLDLPMGTRWEICQMYSREHKALERSVYSTMPKPHFSFSLLVFASQGIVICVGEKSQFGEVFKMMQAEEVCVLL